MSGIDRFLTGNMRPVTINIDSLSPVKVNGFRVNLDGQGWDDFIMLECSNFLQYMFKGGARVLSYDQFREMNDGVSLSVKTPPRGTTTTSSTVRRQESDFDWSRLLWTGTRLMLGSEPLLDDSLYKNHIERLKRVQLERMEPIYTKNNGHPPSGDWINTEELITQIDRVANACMRIAAAGKIIAADYAGAGAAAGAAAAGKRGAAAGKIIAADYAGAGAAGAAAAGKRGAAGKSGRNRRRGKSGRNRRRGRVIESAGA